MNSLELKAYILNKVENAKEVDVTLFDDGAFYLDVKYDQSYCGALFSSTGRMHPLAATAFDDQEDELMSQVQQATLGFVSLKKCNLKGN